MGCSRMSFVFILHHSLLEGLLSSKKGDIPETANGERSIHSAIICPKNAYCNKDRLTLILLTCRIW